MQSLEELNELRKLRLLQKWSQRKLAHELGVDPSTVSVIENGLVQPSEKLRAKIEELKKKLNAVP